ncbi:uncharacterized protein GGS22DRAFT_152102 [Annulohypoxylon maeteangense]|uniref:uncharacterized protein n=1 Tax=Annulohypoxylon maeteangense TaxID=1927788 RepID=UPI0020079286|nr:uncharacterized protein GGS22DRAFT_152102 [Annulohypoxylon maeteangense]KAI0888658.1 hypothetical protein GGS22DRAFT_152102 [Annulohypoxylon maeteangense]
MATQAMSDLSLNPPKPKSKSKKPAAPVADSWEDEDVSDPEPEESITQSLAKSNSKVNDSGFAAPPPTPASPSYSGTGVPPWQSTSTPLSPSGLSPPASPASGGSISDGGPGERRRPEKTDAVARRMIASALGVRAPRPTEEQRAYDRAVREKERKRREEEREAEKRRKEEEDRAKAAIWED